MADNNIIDLVDDSSDDETEKQTKPKASPVVSSERKFQNSVNKPSSVLDSDDDDDFWLQCKPSGLTRKPSRVTSESPTDTSLKGFRIGTGTNQNKARTTPKTWNDVTPCANHSSEKKSINNTHTYNQKKTPPSQNVESLVERQSLGSHRSTSVTIVDLSSPRVGKSKRAAMKNPYINKDKRSEGNSLNHNTAVVVAEARPTPVLCPPKLRDRTKTYPDLRPNIVLALWKYARSNLVRDSRQQIRLDQFMGRIVDLVVSAPDFPIRSVGEYAIRKRGHMSKRGRGGLTNSGDNLLRFENDLESTGVMKSRYSNFEGKYFSICEACLVAMKDTVTRQWKQEQQQQQQQQQQGQGSAQSRLQSFPVDEADQTSLFSQNKYLVSLEDLIPLIDRRLRPECPARLERSGQADKGASYYLTPSTRSAEFKQIQKLLAPVDIDKADGSMQTTSYLKQRTVGGVQHYQLMPLGYEKAFMISKRAIPAPPGPYRFCNIQHVLPKYERICLAVDFREGGSGDRFHSKLHTMCNKLDSLQIPYCVNTLRIGDYCFFSGNKLCPILVERKSVEDVAKSIDTRDGRWASQKLRMYKGQYVFGHQNCRMAYIIEGKLERELVSNYVANPRHKVSKERFEEEIANLRDEGFEVLRTWSVDNSMLELARWAESVGRDIQSGKLPLKYTYDEFLRKVDSIPKNIDFSRLAKYHAKERLHATVDLVSSEESDDDNDGNLSPIVLDERLKRAEKRPAFEHSIHSNKVGASKRFKLDRKKELKTDVSEPSEGKKDYTKWTAAALKEECAKLGMKKSGSKSDLIKRLMDPSSRPPYVYSLRKQRGLYVPTKPDTNATAILVAIQILQDSAPIGAEHYRGATKEEIYSIAEKIDISKDPFCGGTTQTGPYLYDGWSSMGTLKQSGDPPLVVEKKRRFRLSMTGDVSGLKLARAMHVWCHQKGICKCMDHDYEFDPNKWK